MLKEIVKKLPKAEFHLHIEGALPLNLLAQIDKKFETTTPVSWDNSFRFSDFTHFDTTLLGMVVPFYNSPERYAVIPSPFIFISTAICFHLPKYFLKYNTPCGLKFWSKGVVILYI